MSDAAARLATRLSNAGFTADSIAAHLGPHATAALYRGEPGVVLHALDESELSALIKFFILRVPLAQQEFEELLDAELAESLQAAGFVSLISGSYHPALDLRPHVIAGEYRLVISDLDASMTQIVPGEDHVLGVGAASLSLLSATPLTPARRVLDLGAGSGVQALAQATVADQVVATDVHERALMLAQATLAANEVTNVELRHGSWFEPVAGESFDRIVANPPFVVGRAEVGHVYRDSGLDLDGATELVVSTAPEHLDDGGTAFILGSWVHTDDASWEQRVASWVPRRGVSAWVCQRDVVDPGMYVSTWLKDESIDPRSAEGIERTQRWLEHFSANGVTGIGFGWVFLHRIGERTSEVYTNDLSHPFTDPLGPEVEEFFDRVGWLRDRGTDELLDARYALRPGVALEDISLSDEDTGMGFAPAVKRLTRIEGPKFSREVDDALASIVAGLHPDGLSLRDVVGLWAAANGVGEDPAALTELENQATTATADLIRHGFIMPVDLWK